MTACFSGEGAEGFIAGEPTIHPQADGSVALKYEQDLLQTALEKDDAPFLLDLAISGLYTGRMDVSLAMWLAMRLERVLEGEDARELFKLVSPKGRPRGKHGPDHYDTDQVAALRELARRRFKSKGDADDAVAQACKMEDGSSVARLVRDEGYKLAHLDDDMLKVMAGAELLERIDWPEGPRDNHVGEVTWVERTPPRRKKGGQN